ncbi:LacI family DNA-binding transcriptional regulator [Phycicoccus sp. Soil803]|uniref:LacI family DNA-binding transcriptional regulator n=1 Tax=Phycicoccus sp. Soil803 TaxID=1736415 RepID=UPI0009E6DA15|nr:LacI family DNA-binding transcriptional regulator [Phycicoccus sp. Soil803]
MSTIKDVAQAAGVSVATVSRALRGVDRVRPQTRERIQRLAAEMDFVASPTAASLASGRTRVIAVVAPSRTRWYFATLVSGIDRRLRQHDHMVFLLDLEEEGDNPRRRLSQAMLLKRVDGVIALNVPVDPGELEVLDRLDLPLVAVGSPVPGRSLVRIDDVLTARVATEHLIGLGHTRIAFVGPMPDDIAQTQAPLQRLRGFRETVANHGLSVPPGFIIDAGWTALSASRAVTGLLHAPDRPTAVMAASDEMAMGVLQAARRLGLRIPNDLSVIGIDDHVLSEVMDLSTMRQDLQAQGELAAEMLIRRMGDPTLPAEIVTAPTELVLRGTTGSPGPDRTDVEDAWPTRDPPKRGEITDDQIPIQADIPSASALRSHNPRPLGGGTA